MGLDIGVVQIEYLKRPDRVVYDFMRFLNDNSYEADWHVVDGGHAFVEYTRENMLGQLDRYGSENQLSQSDIDGLRSWADGLPWKCGVIMLHLGW